MHRHDTHILSRAFVGAILLLVCAFMAAPLLGGGEWVIIDPNSVGPGQEWYRIVFDTAGNCILSEGPGTWAYYPSVDAYRCWVYRGAFNATQDGCTSVSAAVVRVDADHMSTADLSVIWTTPEWSALHRSGPPAPSDVTTNDAKYVGSDSLVSLPASFFGTVEPVVDVTMGYSPEWVGLEARGKNVQMFRWIAPVCAASQPQGACYDPATGYCTITDQASCLYTWRGEGTTCSGSGGNSGGNSGNTGGPLDFGDAPDSYGTLLKSDGARHRVVTGVHLGAQIDAEADGLPSTDATGDDKNGSDDEDGVVFTSALVPGRIATLDVTASVQGYLNAWVDFDRDGTFAGTGEQIFLDMPLTAGVNHLALSIPKTTTAGDTFARFRFNQRGLLSWKGLAEDGEVEDYKVSIGGTFVAQPNSERGAAKWQQPPQASVATAPFTLKGWSEAAEVYRAPLPADDWQCQDGRPVTGFQWWGTFAGWTQPCLPPQAPTAFQISIWINAPAAGVNSFAHPSALVWQTTCKNWVWTVAGQTDDPRKLSSGEACFEFTCLLSQDQWFYQGSGSGKATYWLSIAAVYDTTTTATYPWGWMTRPTSAGSGAVRIASLLPSGESTVWPPRVASVWSSGTQIIDNRAAQDLAFHVLTNTSSTDSH